MAWGLGYFGMPHILLRFMAIEDAKKLRLSRRVATVWVFIAMGVAILIGIVGSGVIAQGAVEKLDSGNSQRIIIRIAELLSQNGVLAALVAGVILSGILAATMSTADSQLLVAASSITQDLLQDTFKIRLSEKAAMIIARVAVLLIGIIAIIWARKEGSVFRIVSFAWAGFGATFGPLMLFSLFWKRCNQWGALAGMIAGAATIFIWKYAIAPLGGVLAIYELLPAFLVSCLAIVVVSLATGKPDAEITAEFESIEA
jgi:sodium/proline symporter